MRDIYSTRRKNLTATAEQIYRINRCKPHFNA